MKLIQSLLLSFSLFVSSSVLGETLHIAVASNFIGPMKALIKEFETQTNHKVKASYGSSGKIYAQILHGAPYDLFFSADQDKPKQLEEQGLAVQGSRFTYAQGQLVLWSFKDSAIRNKQRLKSGDFSRLAIANPKLAPYGLAAKQVLKSLNLEAATKSKLIVGENISQAYQFVSSGNADLGFVALSQVRPTLNSVSNRYWKVSDDLYEAIKQDAVVLSSSRKKQVALGFISYMQSSEAIKIIEKSGYRLM